MLTTLLGGGGVFISVWGEAGAGKGSHGLVFEWLQPAGGKRSLEVASGAWILGANYKGSLEPVHNAPRTKCLEPFAPCGCHYMIV